VETEKRTAEIGADLDTTTVETVDLVRCPDGLVPWSGDECAPPIGQCANPWELPVLSTAEGPLVRGGCVAVGPRGCEKTWHPDSDVDCEAGELMPCPEGMVESKDGTYCIPRFDDDCGDLEIPVFGGGCKKVGPRWEELGEAEPFFDECESGEFALDGGGCAKVGTRACEKLWNVDSDADCNLWDLSPCLDGWVENEAGTACLPVYDECDTGMRPLLGGGCTGPIAAAEDCPSGPFPETPEGAQFVLYVSCDSNCTDGCGSVFSPFASIQAAVDTASPGAYVLIGPGTYNEGIVLDKPVQIVGLCAAKTVLTGSVVVSSEQTDLHSAAVFVTNSAFVEIKEISVASAGPGVVVVGGAELAAQRLEVSGSQGVALFVGGESALAIADSLVSETSAAEVAWGEGTGLWVESGSSAEVTGTVMEAALGAGVVSTGKGSSVILKDCLVRGTQPGSESGGCGVRVRGEGTAELESTVLEGNDSSGLAVDSGAAVWVTRSVIRDNLPDADLLEGGGIDAREGSSVFVTDSLVSGNRVAGVRAHDESTSLTVERCVIAGTQPTLSGQMGYGGVASGGALLEIVGSLLHANTSAGVFSADAGTEAELVGTLVHDTQPDPEKDGGSGVRATAGSEMRVFVSVLDHNRAEAARFEGVGTHATIEGMVVRDTRLPQFAWNSDEPGVGLYVIEGAAVDCSHLLAERNRIAGVWADYSSQVHISRGMVRDTRLDILGIRSCGIVVSEGSLATLSQVVLTSNLKTGLIMASAETRVEMTDSVIRDTLLDDSGFRGRGIHAGSGELTCTHILVEGSGENGLLVEGEGTVFNMDGSIVRETSGNLYGESGTGIHIEFGPSGKLSDTLISDNALAGLVIAEDGSNFELDGLVIRNTKSDKATGLWGIGLGIQFNAKVTMSRSLIENNMEQGINVAEKGAALTMDRCLVRGTKPNKKGDFGYGIVAANRASLSIDSSLIDSNAALGMQLFGADTTVTVRSTVVRSTNPDGTGPFGRGIQLDDEASLVLMGSLVADNADVGIHATRLEEEDPAKDEKKGPTELEVAGCIIADTRLNNEGAQGQAIVLGSNTMADVSLSLIHDHNTTGVLISSQSETTVLLDSCAVLETGAGGAWLRDPETGEENKEFQVFGDGVAVVGEGAVADISSLVVMGNVRCGVYYYEAAGTVSNSVITGNSSFGLAMESCAQRVDFETAANYVFANALDLPPAQAAEITTSPSGLPVPAPPEPMGQID